MVKWIRIALLISFVYFMFPALSFAFELTIPNAEIDAYMQENGTIEVKETFTYEFEGEFNGAVRFLNRPEHVSILNLEAFEGAQVLPIERINEIENRIHRSGEDEQIIVDLHYTIVDAVEKYEDMAEFSWSFWDSSNEIDYESMIIRVHPPIPGSTTLAIGYNEAENTHTVNESGTVHYNLEHISAGEDAEIRVAYESDLFTMPITKEGTISDEIMADLQEQEEQAAAFQERKNFLSSISLPLVLSLFVLFLLIIYPAIKANRNRKNEAKNAISNLEAQAFPIEQMSMPATIFFMNGQQPTSDALAASLLNLVNLKKIKQIEKESFQLITTENTSDHDRILLQWLFEEIGNCTIFSFEDMKDYLKNEENHTTYHKKISEWSSAVKEEIKETDLYLPRGPFRIKLAFSSLLLIPIIIIFALHNLVWPSVVLGLLTVTILIFCLVHTPLTSKGWEIYLEWKLLRTKIKDITIDVWDSLEEEEKRKVFIFGLGIDPQALKKITDKIPDAFSLPNTNRNGDFQTNSLDIHSFLLMGMLMTSSFQSASTDTQSSSSSTSVGGGTGAGGGGGGSGGF